MKSEKTKKQEKGIIFDKPEVQVVNVIFNDYTSHYSVVKQFVDGLVKKGYSNRKEVIDAIKEYL